MAYRIKPFKIPASALKPSRPKHGPGTFPKPEDTTPTIPHFDTTGLLILGKPVGSVLEWNVAQALDMIGIGYRYQIPVFGGRVIGGAVVDFDVFTTPIATFLFAQGDYWHSRGNKEEEDQFLIARIEAAYHKKCVEIWEHEALTILMAMQTLKERLRL